MTSQSHKNHQLRKSVKTDGLQINEQLIGELTQEHTYNTTENQVHRHEPVARPLSTNVPVNGTSLQNLLKC